MQHDTGERPFQISLARSYLEIAQAAAGPVPFHGPENLSDYPIDPLVGFSSITVIYSQLAVEAYVNYYLWLQWQQRDDGSRESELFLEHLGNHDSFESYGGEAKFRDLKRRIRTFCLIAGYDDPATSKPSLWQDFSDLSKRARRYLAHPFPDPELFQQEMDRLLHQEPIGRWVEVASQLIGFFYDQIPRERPTWLTSNRMLRFARVELFPDSLQGSRDVEPPDGWSDDSLSKVLELAHQNEFATFANMSDPFGTAIEVHDVFRKAVGILDHTKDWLPALFLLKAHSAFLASIRLAAGGQVPEAFILLRGCLEPALYGLYVAQNPESARIWIQRHDGPEHRKLSRREFSTGRLLRQLEQEDTQLKETVRQLYERCIDLGAHPNERAVIQSLKMKQTKEGIELQVKALTDDSDSILLALRSALQVGIATLSVFRLVFRERFDIMGVSEEIGRLSVGL